MRCQILNIDVDETLTKEVCWTPEECLNATPDQDWIDFVNRNYDQNVIAIYTARKHYLYDATIKWLNKHHVKYHYVSFDTKPPGRQCDSSAINNPKES